MKVIEKTKKEKIDWNKPNQIFIYDNVIVISTGKHFSNDFSGLAIKHPSNSEFSTNWSKRHFSLYEGELIISND